jgi:catechol 2,3-dioxygenase-like lactoylglutathione lyase family enzyme
MLKNAPITPYIPAADVGRARRFYEGTLGLVPREEYAGGVFYECGRGTTCIQPFPVARRQCSVGLDEGRRAAARARLGGAVLHYERPEVFNRELLKFLK